MAYESFWPPVTTNLSGTTSGGHVTVTSTAGFYVRQEVTVSQGANVTKGFIKEILSSTDMRIGDDKFYPGTAYDMGGYGAGAVVYAQFQQIRYSNQSNVLKDVYECEPVKALRVMTVDQVGNYVAGGGGGGGASSTVSVNNFPATQPVSLATTAATFQYIKVNASTLTLSNTSSATAFNAGSMSGAARIFSAVSNADQPIGITLNGTQIHELNQGEAFSFDLAANARQINASTTIGLFNVSTSTSNGSIRFNIVS